AFVGSDAFQSTIDNGSVELNLATGTGVTDQTPVVDFSLLNGKTGYTISTGTSTSTVLDFSSRRIHASADNVLLNVAGFVYVEGTVALDIGSQQTVTINSGIPSAIASLAESARGTINSALATLSSDLDKAKSGVKSAFNSAIQTVVNTVNNTVNSVV